MAVAVDSQRIRDAVQAFALEGRFPDDISSMPPVSEVDLEPAIQALCKAGVELKSEIHKINEETKGDVSSWVENAKSLQEDIIRSKAIANDIVRQSEAPDVSGEAIEEAEERAGFLNRELQYSRQLYDVLRSIGHVNDLLSEVEQASSERRILDSLRLLEKSWAELDNTGVSRSCRVMRLLDLRAFELKSDVHEAFDVVWRELVQIDIDAKSLTIHNSLSNQQMDLSQAVIGLRAYKEMDERMEQLWHNIDGSIFAPRMNRGPGAMRSVVAQGDVLELSEGSDDSVEKLLSDLTVVTQFLAEKLPSELLQPLCSFMMDELTSRLIQQWLNPAVPSHLTNMIEFQQMIQGAEVLCQSLHSNGYTGFEKLNEWASKAPTIWLGKCRETTLDAVRSRIMNGVGSSHKVEKIEKQMVSVSEGKELATTGAGATAETNDWGEGWGDAWDEDNDQPMDDQAPPAQEDDTNGDGEDDGADAWGWGDDDRADQQGNEPQQPSEPQRHSAHQQHSGHQEISSLDDEDDAAAAWGWGEEDTTMDSNTEAPSTKVRATVANEETRELILKENYHISSMPQPVLGLISSILEDGAVLTREGGEYAHVASTAPGLFSLPTLVLALFRVISPYYYSLDVGGNMFLYNDAMYLAEQLAAFSATWKEREDLTPRARTMLRLDNDIKSLQGFANRSYAHEMNIQKTILRDLLGGAQSILQQDEMAVAVEAGVARIRTMAATWNDILARSVWCQAVGSLADALAVKIITDVLELSSIGQDEAYSVANLIASATELDDLFQPSKLAGLAPAEDEVPTTAQYAPHWLRLKYLSEVLQSNLNEVRYLWTESELSLYFSVNEVVELIRASFEDNSRTRETIRAVQAKPQPLR